ncbi:MAG: PAS domain S-box protein [Spirochaetia bacterium]
MLVNVLDITRRKVAERELHKSRQLLQTVLDHVPQRVFWKDASLRYLGCNKPFAEDAGLPDAASVAGRDDFGLPWRRSAADYRARDSKVMETGVSQLHFEGLQTRADGRLQWLRSSKVPLRDQDGRVFGVLGTYEDISESRRAEEALRESERHYHKMFVAAQRQAKELELLDRVRTVLMREQDLPVVIRTVVEGIAAVFGYTQVSIYFLKDETLELQHQVGYAVTIDRIPVSQGVSGRVARTGLPVLLEDVRDDPEFIGAIKGLHSEICIPLLDQQRVVGVLNVESMAKLGKADLRLMTVLGEHVSIAIVRARLYAEVRRSEERYRTLVENLGEGIAVVDPEENFLFDNPAAEKVFGVAWGSLAGLNLQQFVSEEEYKRVRMETKKRQRGETSTFEQQIIRRDGTQRWIELTSTPQYDHHGAFSHTLVIFRDITEGKDAERKLRESEERFRQLGEAALEGIAITEKGILIDANARLAMMLGYELAEMLGKPVADFIAPDSRELVAEHIAENYTRQYEHSLRRKDGSALLVESHARMIDRDGRQMRVTALLDVSERSRAQEELHKLSLAVSQGPASIVITDVQGNIEYVNPKFTQLTGYSADEVLGKNPRILKSGHTSPHEYVHLWETITAGREWRGELLNRRKNGELFWELATISAVRNAAHAITHFVAVKEDITERKRAQDEHAKLQAQLQQAQKMESVGRLAGGVAHDFNNMLGVILGHAEMALEKLDPSLPLHEDLTEIRKAAERSTDLTRQLLSFARRQTVTPKVLDLNETVGGMLKMLKRLIGEDIVLDWQPTEGVWPVRVDPSQVDQILANLCVNARDAISGAGRITIKSANSVLNEVVDEGATAFHANVVPGEYVLLTISDDGSGMDEETISHIFEPFFTTKGVGKGTGLGLATVYGAVKQNNGFIIADSEPGRGTTFSIYLPRFADKAAQAERQRSAEPSLPGQETILLVEDEPANLKLIMLMLKKRGYTTLVASTPGEAIRIAREHAGEIHLLVTDVVMPEMNGRELASRLLPLFPRLKTLFMSGYTADIIAHHGVLEDGVRFIQKPFSSEGLADKIREILSAIAPSQR